MEAKISDTQNSWYVVLFVIFTRKTLPFKASLETYVGWVERSETHHFAPAALNDRFHGQQALQQTPRLSRGRSTHPTSLEFNFHLSLRRMW